MGYIGILLCFWAKPYSIYLRGTMGSRACGFGVSSCVARVEYLGCRVLG